MAETLGKILNLTCPRAFLKKLVKFQFYLYYAILMTNSVLTHVHHTSSVLMNTFPYVFYNINEKYHIQILCDSVTLL